MKMGLRKQKVQLNSGRTTTGGACVRGANGLCPVTRGRALRCIEDGKRHRLELRSLRRSERQRVSNQPPRRMRMRPQAHMLGHATNKPCVGRAEEGVRRRRVHKELAMGFAQRAEAPSQLVEMEIGGEQARGVNRCDREWRRAKIRGSRCQRRGVLREGSAWADDLDELSQCGPPSSFCRSSSHGHQRVAPRDLRCAYEPARVSANIPEEAEGGRSPVAAPAPDLISAEADDEEDLLKKVHSLLADMPK